MADEPAFVAGATGYTGREVVRALRDRGKRTVAHIRPDSSKREMWTARFTELGAEVDVTPWEQPAMEATFTRLQPAMVFALLGTTKARAKIESATYDTVDYGLTAMLMKSAVAMKSSGAPLFVYLSSAGMTEKEPRRRSYMYARWRVERELAESGLPHVIARPSIITGTDRDDDRLGERLGGKVLDGALTAVSLFGGGRLRERYRSTTNVALAEALVRHALAGGDDRRIVESEHLR